MNMGMKAMKRNDTTFVFLDVVYRLYLCRRIKNSLVCLTVNSKLPESKQRRTLLRAQEPATTSP
jgi:hypothetical protein